MKKLLSTLLCLLMALGALSGALAGEDQTPPKYVFMFIGDGTGSPQITATQYYVGTLENPDALLPTPAQLSFTDWTSVGLLTTYDATSFCPDSASTATSLASGEKTLSGVINYNVEKTESFKLISEYAKESGRKVGVITSVSLDHATPAAYYAKAQSRSEYYNIACQGVTGQTLDFLGGGGFLQPDGPEGNEANVYDLARENGFTVADTYESIDALNAGSGRVLLTVPDMAPSAAMQYEIDRAAKAAAGERTMSLADVVKAGIRVLDNEQGFFLMTEGGKIDWSCHANDAATSIHETLALSDAVEVALDFAAGHPDETLIIVTGDHETGGLTIGFAATAYDTHFAYLQNQKISYEAYDAQIEKMREAGASFEQALASIEENFGLTTAENQPLSLTEDELSRLQAAYDISMTEPDARELTYADELAYGGYEPLSMQVCHILNNKAGIAYTSYAHTGLQIPVYAYGVGAGRFQGSYDNTQVFDRTMAVMGLEG